MMSPQKQPTQRRIQKTGGSSYTITLPKHWVTNQHLSEQDEVMLFAHETGALCLQPLRKKQLLTRYLSLESKTPTEIDRELIASYIAGAEQIILTSHSMTAEFRRIIRNNILKLANFDIFESTNTKVVLKYAASSTIPAQDYINKSIRLVTSMLIDTLQALELRDRSIAQEVIERDADIDRINLIILRQFNQFLTTLVLSDPDVSLPALNYYKHLSIRLERIADHIVRICTTFLQLKSQDEFCLQKTEITLTKKLISDFEKCEGMIHELDKTKAHELIDEYEDIKKNSHLKRKAIMSSTINVLIQDSLERIRSYIANIAEETLDYCTNMELIKK